MTVLEAVLMPSGSAHTGEQHLAGLGQFGDPIRCPGRCPTMVRMAFPDEATEALAKVGHADETATRVGAIAEDLSGPALLRWHAIPSVVGEVDVFPIDFVLPIDFVFPMTSTGPPDSDRRGSCPRPSVISPTNDQAFCGCARRTQRRLNGSQCRRTGASGHTSGRHDRSENLRDRGSMAVQLQDGGPAMRNLDAYLVGSDDSMARPIQTVCIELQPMLERNPRHRKLTAPSDQEQVPDFGKLLAAHAFDSGATVVTLREVGSELRDHCAQQSRAVRTSAGWNCTRSERDTTRRETSPSMRNQQVGVEHRCLGSTDDPRPPKRTPST